MTQAQPKIRLYVPGPYAAGAALSLSSNQSHYLTHVMRASAGMPVAVFNGEQGEWLAEVYTMSKKSVSLTLRHERKSQHASPDLWLAFSPIKQNMERMVEKAVELGVSRLLPVITRHAIVRSVNEEKLMAHAIEAAEQCERCDVPALTPYKDLASLLGNWPADRLLLHADETGGGKPLAELLAHERGQKFGILIGPEGGFAAEERAMIAQLYSARGFGMGPRILRADTAALAALACVQSATGDWQHPPRFESATA